MIDTLNFESINISVNILGWLVALFVGGFAGFIYFMGLWLTVKQLPLSKSPALLMLSSLLFRMAIVMSVFYLIMLSIGWQGVMVALLGFIGVRVILTRRYKPETELPVSVIDTVESP